MSVVNVKRLLRPPSTVGDCCLVEQLLQVASPGIGGNDSSNVGDRVGDGVLEVECIRRVLLIIAYYISSFKRVLLILC